MISLVWCFVVVLAAPAANEKASDTAAGKKEVEKRGFTFNHGYRGNPGNYGGTVGYGGGSVGVYYNQGYSQGAGASGAFKNQGEYGYNRISSSTGAYGNREKYDHSQSSGQSSAAGQIAYRSQFSKDRYARGGSQYGEQGGLGFAI